MALTTLEAARSPTVEAQEPQARAYDDVSVIRQWLGEKTANDAPSGSTYHALALILLLNHAKLCVDEGRDVPHEGHYLAHAAFNEGKCGEEVDHGMGDRGDALVITASRVRLTLMLTNVVAYLEVLQ